MEAYGPAILRVMVGAMFMAHGAQKLFGMFGGAGLAGTAAGFDASGLAPGFPLAVAVGIVDAAAGEDVRAAHEGRVGMAADHEHLGSSRAVAQHHHGSRRPRVGGNRFAHGRQY